MMSAIDADFQIIVKKIRASATERHEVVRMIANDVKLMADIQNYVLKNNGSANDGQMVFHDSIIAFVKKVFTDRNFELTNSHQQYLFGIAKNIWLSHLRKKSKLPVTQTMDHVKETSSDDETDKKIFSDDKLRIIHKILDVLRPNCKEVLLHWAGGYSMLEIAEKLGFPTEGAARKKKCECYKGLIEWLEKHPHYIKELKY